MTDVTCILARIEAGDLPSSEQLFPLVYDELRRLAAIRMMQESTELTLQPTALVHEAYVRLVDVDRVAKWNSRGHFFGAAAEVMRRILVERARHAASIKAGGRLRRQELSDVPGSDVPSPLELLALNEAIDRLALRAPRKAQLVKLRFFAGLTMSEAAEALGISVSTADDDWAYARCWLRLEMEQESQMLTQTSGISVKR